MGRIYTEGTYTQNQWIELIACDYYKVYKMNLNGMMFFEQTHPFMNVSVIEGCGIVNGRVINKGDHFILPGGYGIVEFAGEMELIASTVQGLRKGKETNADRFEG